MPEMVKALVITGYGINCEEEMAAAYRLAGAQSDIVHLNDIFQEKITIHDYDILNFPGGFSFGDDLGSGKVLANKMQYRNKLSGKTFLRDIREFLAAGKFLLGVCNGFQFLVKMGLLPDINGLQQQEVTLTRNNSGRFEDRWCHLRVNPGNNTPFLKGINQLYLPVRHGEGRLIIPEEMQKKIVDNKLNSLSYCTAGGEPTSRYPGNPNGSHLNCAALCNATGQVLGLMPHPEAFLSLYNHPNWPRLQRENPEISEAGEGLQIFRNIVEHVAVNRV